jgi:hypothetical protein
MSTQQHIQVSGTKKADVKDVAIELIGDTGITWNRITLIAEVRVAMWLLNLPLPKSIRKKRMNGSYLALTSVASPIRMSSNTEVKLGQA